MDRKSTSYETLAGRTLDLDTLTHKERDVLSQVFDQYRTRPPWDEFSRTWKKLALEGLGPAGLADGPVWHVCQDLASRLGFLEGVLAPPDYRDRLAALIDSRFRSRYEFCQQTGIDEGHLSRVLAGRKHFTVETLSKVLNALDYQISFAARQDVGEIPCTELPELVRQLALDPALARLTELNRKLQLLEARPETGADRSRAPFTPAQLDAAALQPQDHFEMAKLLFIDRDIAGALTAMKAAAYAEKAALARRILNQAEATLHGLSRILTAAGSIPMATRFRHPKHGADQSVRALFQFGVNNVGLHLPADCFFLFYPQSLAGEPLIQELGLSLEFAPSIIQAESPEVLGAEISGKQPDETGAASGLPPRAPAYGWVALLNTPHLANIRDRLTDVAAGHGARFCGDLSEAKKFLGDAASRGKLFPDAQPAELVKHLADRHVIRLLFNSVNVRRPALFEISHTLGLSFVLVHACVVGRGVCDFIALDRHGKPLEQGNSQLRLLTDRRFVSHFGVDEVHWIGSVREFRTKGLGRLALPPRPVSAGAFAEPGLGVAAAYGHIFSVTPLDRPPLAMAR